MEHLKEKNLEHVVANIRELLANLHIHYQNIRNFHWNIIGRNFIELHEYLEGLYKSTEEFIDEAAERLRALGTYPLQTLKECLIMAEVQEQVALTDPWQMIKVIQQSNDVIALNLEAILRAAGQAEDFGSNDMFATRLREIEKQGWTLGALIAQE